MPRPAGTSLLDRLSAPEDPRQAAKVLHPLPGILLLSLCATPAGADDLVEIALWGSRHLGFLRRFRPYRHGTPGHDTPGAVLGALDPELFKACFASWVEGLRGGAPGLVAIGGETSRRGHARSKGREPLHLVSAWASRRRLVLGQEMLGMVEATTERGGRVEGERRYDLASARLDAPSFARAVRGHRGIENRPHWVLGVVSKDGLARLRTGHAPASMAVVRHMALDLLRQAEPATGPKNRGKPAGRSLDRLTRGTA